MPRSDGGPYRLGIRYEHDVLTGKISVEEAQAQLNDRAGHPANCYTSPQNYHPVLRYHLRNVGAGHARPVAPLMA